jgi:hypothetical protein
MPVARHYTVNEPPTAESPEGFYYVKKTDDLFDTYIVEKSAVRKQTTDYKDEYGIFPDEEEGLVDYIYYNPPGYVLNPAIVGSVFPVGHYFVDTNYRTFVYPVIPGRTYEITFYAKKACSVRAFPDINMYNFGRSVYNIPEDLETVAVQYFTFTADKNDNSIAITAALEGLGGAMPVVAGPKSAYYRYLNNGTMELKPIMGIHPSFNYIDIGTGDNYRVSNPYFNYESVIAAKNWGESDQIHTIIYKLKKGKMYNISFNVSNVWPRSILCVLPVSDLPALTGFQEPGTARLFKNTKWEDVFWNDSAIDNISGNRKGFKRYLCKEDDMYLALEIYVLGFSSITLVEYEPIPVNKLFKYKDFDIQKYVPGNTLGRINLIGTLPASKPTVKRCDAEINVGGIAMNTKVDISVQGHFTATLPAKGYTMDILEADGSGSRKVQFGAWRPFDSYYLKAYMNDATKCRDILANRIFEQMKLTLPEGRQRNWERAGMVNQYPTGAMGHIDGMPFELFVNGEYHGLYFIDVKKNRDNYMMGKNDTNQIWIDVGLTGFGGANTPYNVIEIRNPKISGYTEETVPPEGTVKTAIDNFWNWLGGDWPNRTKEEIEQNLDMVSVIDTYILYMLIHMWDGNSNNMFFSTYDGGQKWFYEIYDFNDTFGKSSVGFSDVWEYLTFGTQPNRADFNSIRGLYFNEIRYRWRMLVDAGVMTQENIINEFYKMFNLFGYDGLKKFWEKWNLSGLPGVDIAGITQLERYIKVGIASLNDSFDVYELVRPIENTNMFK